MPTPATSFTGMGGSLTFGGTVFPVAQWSLTNKNETQDVTDTGSNGWVVRIGGVRDAELTCSFFPTDTNLLNLQQAIIPNGSVVTAVLQEGPASLNAAWNGSFLVSSCGTENDPKTAVKINMTAQSTGEVTFSVGSVTIN